MYNDHTTREQRLGTPDDSTVPWGLVIIMSVLFFIALGLAGSADLAVK